MFFVFFVSIQEPRLSLTEPAAEVMMMMMLRGGYYYWLRF